MASADHSIPQRIPALAFTYEGGDRELLERIAPLVDLIEITPDTIAASERGHSFLRPELLDEYASLPPCVQFIAHGIGLSIGTFDHWNERYLRLLDELTARIDLQWHSEHLAFTTVAGENSGTMFTLPRTEESLDLVCERVRRIQDLYPMPFLLENVVQLLPDPPSEYTPAGFLNAITKRTGCGLILDAYNLQCDAHNLGLNVNEFMNELNWSAVREIHLAGGVLYKGFQLDIHSNATSKQTLDSALEAIRHAPHLRAVTFELLKEAVPLLGHEGIRAELIRIREAIQSCDSKPTSAAFSIC